MAETLKGSNEGTPDILSYASCMPGTSDSEVGQYFRGKLAQVLAETAQVIEEGD